MDFFIGLWESFQEFFRDALQWIAGHVEFLGGHRWAAAIVLLTLVVKTALLPLAIKQIRSMRGMQRLQPEMKRLQQKYKNDKQKQSQELMELYRREGVNPLGSCLPIVAQMPVLFAMYWAIRDLGGRVDMMPFLGLGNLAENASQSIAGILLLVVMTATSFVMMRQTVVSQDPMQARLMKVMPFIFPIIMINFPAGLVLYWTTQNVYQLVQQTIMLRRHPTPVQANAQPKSKAKPGGKGKAAPKSKPHPRSQLKQKSKKPNKRR